MKASLSRLDLEENKCISFWHVHYMKALISTISCLAIWHAISTTCLACREKIRVRNQGAKFFTF